MASELVTNAVRHGSKPSGTVVLIVRVETDHFAVTVRDAGTGLVDDGEGTSHGGFGLAIAEDLSEELRIDRSGSTEETHAPTHGWNVTAIFRRR